MSSDDDTPSEEKADWLKNYTKNELGDEVCRLTTINDRLEARIRSLETKLYNKNTFTSMEMQLRKQILFIENELNKTKEKLQFAETRISSLVSLVKNRNNVIGRLKTEISLYQRQIGETTLRTSHLSLSLKRANLKLQQLQDIKNAFEQPNINSSPGFMGNGLSR